MHKFIDLLRVKHWVKNSYFFIPLFFSGNLFHFEVYPDLLLGFISFSLIASAVYILNDLNDISNDRIHPIKRLRPIASGHISIHTAIWVIACCVVAGLSVAYIIKAKFLFICVVYLLLNIFYSLGLKRVAILDIFIVAIGFNLRVKAGGVIADVAISEWLMVMVFLLSLFLVLAKRRDDIVLKERTGLDMRKVATMYNESFLTISLAMLSSVIIVSYLLYSLSPEVMQRFATHRLYYTAIFVIAGILRYLQITLVENDSGSPTQLLYKDRFIQLCIFLWIFSFYLLIYFTEFEFF